MFGRNWQEADAKVVAAEIGEAIQGGVLMNAVYVVDVSPADAPAFRARVENVQAPGITILEAGDTVRVRYDGKGRVEIVEKGDPRFDTKVMRVETQSRLDALMAQPPGTPAPDPAEEVDPDMAKLDALLRDEQP